MPEELAALVATVRPKAAAVACVCGIVVLGILGVWTVTRAGYVAGHPGGRFDLDAERNAPSAFSAALLVAAVAIAATLALIRRTVAVPSAEPVQLNV